MPNLPSFSTSRLVFRSPEPADYEHPNGFLWNLYNDEQTLHGLTASSVCPSPRDKVEKWFKDFAESAAIHCIFCLKSEDSARAATELEPVGWLSLDKIAGQHRKATFGLAISTKHQGKGYSKEAMEWLLERAFNGFGLNKVEGEVFAWNERALRCYKSVGFVEEGYRRQTVWHNGAFIDDFMIGILASEWRERQQKQVEERKP